MKRLTIVLAALGVLVLFSMYCAKVEFDNVIDSKNSENFLREELKICDRVWPCTMKLDDGGIYNIYKNCDELVIAALAEDRPGVANILNADHPIFHYCNEDTTGPKVIITNFGEVSINNGDLREFKKWMGNVAGGLDEIWVSINTNISGVEKIDAVLRNTSGELLPEYDPYDNNTNVPPSGMYFIVYQARKVFKNRGEVLANASRVLKVREPIEGDTGGVILSIGTPDLLFTVSQQYYEPAASAETEYIPSTGKGRTNINGSIVRTTIPEDISNIVKDGICIGVGEFTIKYTVCNPNAQHKCTTATRRVQVTPNDQQLPSSVIVLNKAPFRGLSSKDMVIEGNTSFTEPGYEAYYVKDGNRHDIDKGSVIVNKGNGYNFADGNNNIIYEIASNSIYKGTSVNRAVFKPVPAGDCDNTSPPTLTKIGPDIIEISPNTVFNPRDYWTVTGNDEYRVTTFRLTDFGELDPQNPAKGTYTIKVAAVGACGGVSPVQERTVIVK
ncbi:MAG: hypothetical protein LBI42_04315 [Chitinispirillales bacterium]|jgi:hypothetical protein|nr:hypothetical protein [Chitinispirillales bacterium]